MEILDNILQGKQINTDMILTMIISLYGITIVMFLFKSIPMNIINVLLRLFTTKVLISSMDECYFSLVKLFQKNNIVHRSRTLRFMNGKYGGSDLIDKSIGTGVHLFFYKRIPIKVFYEIEKTLYSEEKIHITLTKLGRSHKLFDELREELQALIETNEDIDKLVAYSYDPGDYCWRTETRIRKRFFDTIFIDDAIKHRLINHLDNFYAKEDWYHERGIPYQTGICLYGPAGTGKTSIVKGLASHYNKNLCILRSSEIDYLPKALKKLPHDAFIVIEDIDTSSIVMERNPDESLEEAIYNMGRKANNKGMSASNDERSHNPNLPQYVYDKYFNKEAVPDTIGTVEKVGKKIPFLPDGKAVSKNNKAIDIFPHTKVLLSDVLNAMDGLVSIDKRVIIFTTNHLEKLDRALIRPGRIDCLEMIDYISYDQFIRFCHLFYKGVMSDDEINKLTSKYYLLKPKVTVAELQKDFMQGMSLGEMVKTYCE
jgi:chaperone BCS1